MAEFQEVVRQRNRMCKLSKCYECPINGTKTHINKKCTIFIIENYEEAEKIIMDWADEHSEPQYPTWVEWQGKIFPASLRPICPLGFMIDHTSAKMCISEGVGCGSCVLRERQIPADIAEKLGIEPKEVE